MLKVRFFGWSVILCLAFPGMLRAEDDTLDSQRIQAAIKSGRAVLEKGVKNYPSHRQCFSCHHQTLPLLALTGFEDVAPDQELELRRSVADFTHKSFADKLDSLRTGSGVGGGAFTVGYGLWTLNLAGRGADDTTEAMVAFLLRMQKEDGHWKTGSNRPPLEESSITTTVLASYYLSDYAAPAQREAVLSAQLKARRWLIAAPVKSEEDRNFKLLGLIREQYKRPVSTLGGVRAGILAAQRADGGWGQLDDMASDAYATGQTLWVLQQPGSPLSPAVRRGIKFLLDTQESDGSWHVKTRSKPVQVYFDNGDPHGKDQFISISATSWAVAALAKAAK